MRKTKLLPFGKLDLSAPPPLRATEIHLRVRARKGPEAWRSEYRSVQNTLQHYSRYSGSESTREKFLQLLSRFCSWSGYDPNELVFLPKHKIKNLIQSFVDEIATRGRSKSYLNSLIKRLKTFFRTNGHKNLNVATYFVPTRYRKRPEYIPTPHEIYMMADVAGGARNRAVILCLWSSGLRVSTLCALNYGDVMRELKGEEAYAMVPVYPEMKNRVADACKGLIPYYTFLSREASESLRVYIRERAEKYGPVKSEDPLFYSEWNFWERGERASKRLGRRAVGKIVKRAARLAGIKEWRLITPNCLRKAFESVLRAPMIDGGRMDISTQQFFFGHILPGAQDTYYDKSSIDFHRKEYSRLDFSARQMMKAKVVDKLVPVESLERWLNEGWLFVAKVSDTMVVVRRSGNTFRTEMKSGGAKR